jgi:hypothetical protein
METAPSVTVDAANAAQASDIFFPIVMGYLVPPIE